MNDLNLTAIDPFQTTPPVPVVAAQRTPESRNPDETVRVLGVDFTNVTPARAVQLVREMTEDSCGQMRSVFFANAHTLNLAAADSEYRELLRAASHVFGDGTGVRWAARMNGVHMRGNLNGTDLVPHLLASTPGRRYFLLGADAATIRRAAAAAESRFPNWTQAGFHHGYVHERRLSTRAIRKINAAQPDVLLVGMGNPHQERWICRHRSELCVPVCMGVGGLFDFWANNVSRAPRWLRRLGHEWVWRLVQQPGGKARRYLLGNPLFLARAWLNRK